MADNNESDFERDTANIIVGDDDHLGIGFRKPLFVVALFLLSLISASGLEYWLNGREGIIGRLIVDESPTQSMPYSENIVPEKEVIEEKHLTPIKPIPAQESKQVRSSPVESSVEEQVKVDVLPKQISDRAVAEKKISEDKKREEERKEKEKMLAEIKRLTANHDSVTRQNDALLKKMDKLSDKKSALTKELLNSKRDILMLNASNKEKITVENERNSLRQKITKLNKLVAAIQKDSGDFSNSEFLKKASKTDQDKFKVFIEDKESLENKVVDLKKLLSAFENRERKRPDLNKQILEQSKKIDNLEAKETDLKKNLIAKSDEIVVLERDKREADKLKEALKKTRDELSNVKDSTKKTSSAYHYNLGIVYKKNAMYRESVKEFSKALEIAGDDPSIHFNLAVIFDDYLHTHKKAVEHYRKYLELSPDSEDAGLVKGWLREAERYLEE